MYAWAPRFQACAVYAGQSMLSRNVRSRGVGARPMNSRTRNSSASVASAASSTACRAWRPMRRKISVTEGFVDDSGGRNRLRGYN